MTDDRIDRIEEQLRRRYGDLQEIERTAAEGTRTVELDQSRVGRLSRMDAMQSQQMSLEAKRRRELEKQRIEAALRRIAAGEFGICTRCEDEIGIGRLEANPTAVLCIECAEAANTR